MASEAQPTTALQVTGYEPKGKMLQWLTAMRAAPENTVWTAAEAAQVMGCPVRQVNAYAAYALDRGVIFRQVLGAGKRRKSLFSLQPFPSQAAPRAVLKASRERMVAKAPPRWVPEPDDLRIPRVVPGWKPPVMVPPRVTKGGAS